MNPLLGFVAENWMHDDEEDLKVCRTKKVKGKEDANSPMKNQVDNMDIPIRSDLLINKCHPDNHWLIEHEEQENEDCKEACSYKDMVTGIKTASQNNSDETKET